MLILSLQFHCIYTCTSVRVADFEIGALHEGVVIHKVVNMAARLGRRLLGRLAKDWAPQRVLIARKTSRFEYERMRYPEKSDHELKDMVSKLSNSRA